MTMKTKRFAALAVALAMVIALAGCGADVPSVPSSTGNPAASASPRPDAASAIRDNLDGKTLNEFTVEAELDPSSYTVSVKQELKYVNNTGTELSGIYFNLIPNAFAADGGGIDLSSVSAGGRQAAMTQVNGTVYSLALPEPLAAGADTVLSFDYTVRIPNIENRFGWQEGIINAGNFLITPCVYENGGWVVEPYVDIGDAFYTDMADYNVTVSAPEGWTIASAGSMGNDGAYHGRMRDYVFSASDGFETLSDTVDGVDVTVYYRDGMSLTAQRALETSANSLALYDRILGQYPYDTLSVVLSGLTSGVSGTEYPTLVMVGPEMSLEEISQPGFSTDAEYNGYCWQFDRTVTHEVAHQWFYGVVGNDQIRYPWLDEGFCRFAELLYMEAYPPEEPLADWQYDIGEFFQSEYDLLTGKIEGISVDMTLDLYEWAETKPADYGLMYDKCASLWYMLRETLGAEEFNAALREYVDEFAYGFVTPDAFKAFWSGYGDVDELLALYGV